MSKLYPLAAFERYMLLDDQDVFSMTCYIRFWFEGTLRRDDFETSLTNALARHPILSSRLVQIPHRFGVFKRDAFQPVPVVLDEILDWQEGFAPTPASRITRDDMRTRFIVRTDQDQSMVAVQFHHSTTDGIGVFQFAEDLMLLYDQRVRGTAVTLRSLDESLLDRRVTFGLTWGDWIKRIHLDLNRIRRFFGKFPAPIAATIPKNDRTAYSDPGAAVRVVTPFAMMSNAQAQAKSLDVTFNDLMIARLLKACLSWNRVLGAKIRNWQTFRVNVPVSLRTPAEDAMPAANYVSMVFLDRLPALIDDEAATVKSITAEMNQVKRDRMGFALIFAVTTLMRSGFFKPILKSGLCMTTVGLTNLGQPFRDFSLTKDGCVHTGNVKLIGLDTFPPVRRNTLATISVNRYAGNLSMTCRYDSTSWRPEDAEAYLRNYLDRLTNESTSAPSTFGLVVKSSRT